MIHSENDLKTYVQVYLWQNYLGNSPSWTFLMIVPHIINNSDREIHDTHAQFQIFW